MPRHRHAPSLLLLVLTLWGCSSDTAPETVASVSVSPPTASVSVGGTTQLAATVTGSGGGALTGRPVTWTSSNTGVAAVSGSGQVTGVSAGTALITAASEGRTGSASVTVLPPPVASVVVAPAALNLVVGDTAALTATARDAGGATLGGRPVTWTSVNAAIAAVNTNGQVFAVSAGETQVTATVEGQSATVPVRVAAPPPAITGLSPARLVEGGTATLEGRGFATAVGGNTVRVDGVDAVVTAVTATTIQFTVPSFPCRPARRVAVALTIGAGEALTVTHPLRPAAFTEVTVGQQVVLSEANQFCFQFDSAAGPAEYLIGVQSVVSSATSLTAATLTGSIPAGAQAGRSRAAVASRTFGGLDPTTAGFRLAGEAEALDRQRAAEVRLRLREQEMLAPRAAAMLTGPAQVQAASVPPDAQVGDRFAMRVPAFLIGDPCTDFDPIEVVVRHIGTRGIWVEDVANPANGFTAQDFVSLSTFLDQDVYDTMTDYFGPPSDLDGNGRIVVVATKEANRRGLSFVARADLFPRATCASSNEGEVYYAFVPDPNGTFGSPAVRANVLGNARRLLPHEFTHILQFSQRRAVAGAVFSEPWEFEGQAQLAEEVMGHHLTGRQTGRNYGLSIAFNNPATTDVWWYTGFSYLGRYFGFDSQQGPRVAGAPEQCTFLGRSEAPCLVPGLYWYGVSWSLQRWLSDHFGADFPGGERGFHQALIRDAGSGFATFSRVLGRPIEELLPKWAASLYVDGRVAGADPLLTMPSWDLAAIQAGLVPTARLQPVERGFADFTWAMQVRGGSTAYFTVSGEDRPATALRAVGANGAPLPGHMRYWIVRLR